MSDGRSLVEQTSTTAIAGRYDELKRALDEATTLDEVMDIHHAADAMKLMGKFAKDAQEGAESIAKGVDLKFRSERRIGVLIFDLKERGLLDKGGRPTKVAKEQNAEIVKLVDVGIDWKLSSRAQELAAYDMERFEKVIKEGLEKIRAGRAIVVNPVKDLTTQDKAIARAVKAQVLAARGKELPKGQWQVILADPEWPFDVWSAAGMDRSADNHYPTSALEVIQSRDVAGLAAPDAILFMWVTAPHHVAGNGAMIMRAWGFEPKAEIIWDKGEVGTGYWFRNQHEILMVGVRGNIPAPAMGSQWPSLIRAPKGEHSEKPDWQYDLAEQYFPGAKRIELNARRRRDGWDAWGFEAPDDVRHDDRADLTDGHPGSPVGQSLPQEPPADLAGVTPRPGEPGQPLSELAADVEGPRATRGADVGVGGRALAATPETDGTGSSAAPGAGEDEVSHVLPHSGVPTAQLTSEQQNDIIKACYEMAEFPGLDEVAGLTGLNANTIKQRAKRRGWGNPDRQRQALARYNEGQKAA